jgi:NAD(P)-dependent dehydrogenase (short-subunit alcohol dehydrogenase family)
LQGQVAVEQFGTLDILVANSGGLLERSRVTERSLMLWQQALAKEMGPQGIRVNSAAPGRIATQCHINGGQRLF